jgi:hypothetical protein
LQNSSKCGFTHTYIDPKYCNITLNAGSGSVSPSTLTVMQNSKIGTLPTPTLPANATSFDGWYTQADG